MSKLIASTAAFAIAAATALPALAQEVVLPPEVRTEVREYVIREAPPPMIVPDGYSIVIGEPIPPEVEIYTFEEMPAVVDYGYVVVENRTVLVDPYTREVIEIIE